MIACTWLLMPSFVAIASSPHSIQKVGCKIQGNSPYWLRDGIAVDYKGCDISEDNKENDPDYIQPQSHCKKRKYRPGFRVSIKRKLTAQQETPRGHHIVCFRCAGLVSPNPRAIHIDHHSKRWALRRDDLLEQPDVASLSSPERRTLLRDSYNESPLRKTCAHCNLTRRKAGETPAEEGAQEIEHAKTVRSSLFQKEAPPACELD